MSVTATPEQREAAAEKARQWVQSPEGQAALTESLLRAEETAREFREAQRVNPNDLHQPMTI